MNKKMNHERHEKHEKGTTENTERHGKEKKGLSPMLRFPEFRDSGEWEEKRLEDIAPLQRGFDLPSEQIESGIIPVVYSNGVQNFHNIGMAKGPGIVTGRSGTIGKIHFIEDGDYWPHNTSLWVTSFQGNIPKFIYFLYNFIGFNRFASGSGVPTLNRNYVHAFYALIPKKPEQQKIADCLTSLDELITAEAGKLEAFKVHKKGLMQKLFPAEGETIPEWRFPEFRDNGEWEEKRLEEICDINPSNTGLPDTFVYIDLESVDAGELKVKKKIYRVDAPSRAQRVLQHGDVIYQIVRPYQKNNFFCAFDDDCNYVASTGYAQLRAFGYKEFLYQIIHEDNFVGRVIAKCTGSNYPAINSSDLAKIHLAIPSLPEQQKIADCLSSLDELITAQAQKIETLKAHKKGLMQGLFPSAEENI